MVTKVKWDLYKMVRQRTLNELTDLTNEEADFIPEGFHNNIHWNLAHIHYVSGSLLQKFTGEGNLVPSVYPTYFAPGTKPADWDGNVPSLEVVKKGLEEQIDQLEILFAKRLNDALVTPCNMGQAQLLTIGELLDFVIFHEGLHIGAIKGLKRAAGK